MVGDLRDLNRIKIKNQACLPNIEDLFDVFQGITYFTMPHLRSGYNQIRMEEAATPSNNHRYSILVISNSLVMYCEPSNREFGISDVLCFGHRING